MQKIDGKLCNFIIPHDLSAEVDRIARRTNQTRSEVMRNLLWFGSDVFRMYEATGAVRFMEALAKAKKTLSKSTGQQSLFAK